MSGGEIPMTMAIADITQLVMGKPTLVQIWLSILLFDKNKAKLSP